MRAEPRACPREMEAALLPSILRWTQHDPTLEKEIKSLVPAFGRSPSESSGADSSEEYCFVRHKEHGYVPARRNGELQFIAADGSQFSVKSSAVMKGGDGFFIPLSSPDVLGLAFDDMVNLDELNEATILHSLRVRFERDRFYTSVGTILVSLNPFKWVTELYTPDVMDFYRDNRYSSFEKPPHVFDLAERSFCGLLENGQDQAIIISGESGAGKTEAAKKCVAYLAVASSHHAKSGQAEKGGRDTEHVESVSGVEPSVADRIMSASPLLEAFGNAKTLRNNNSSRFGKWMVIQFNARDCSIVGCSNTNYLLEKSRVVNQDKGERNFHIFYQVLLGAPESVKVGLCGLHKDAAGDDFHYVSQSGCVKVEGKSDKQDFKEVCDALDQLAFSDKEKQDMFSLIGAILYLGNVTFQEREGGSEGSKVEPNSESADALAKASELLGINPSFFERALTITMLTSGRGSFIAKQQTVEKATESRDAIAKALYNRMFDWLVRRINKAVAEKEAMAHGLHDGTKSVSKRLRVGILDIFGFEIFEENSFEQLCINFANERLQQHFNNSTFKEETKVYQAEGVKYDDIVFIDNADVIHLVGAKGGIFHSLDEEIKVPRGSSKGFFNKLIKKYSGEKAHQRLSHKAGSGAFCVKHYAGDVNYQYRGFLEKNKDTLFKDLTSLLASTKSCKKGFVRSLFGGELNDNLEEKASREAMEDSSTLKSETRGRSSSLQLFRAAAKTVIVGNRKRKMSVSGQFRSQLDSLIQTLNACYPHYIRCIKANSLKKPDVFMGDMILEQLRYSGVFEAVEIRRSGFPCRRDHASFRNRYLMLLKREVRDGDLASCGDGNYREQCAVMVREFATLDASLEGLQLGKTMVLYKADHQRLLERLRMSVAEDSLHTIQRFVRGTIGRMLAKSIRNLPRFTNEAIRSRTLVGVNIGTAMPATVKWAEDLKRRCNALSDIEFSRVDPEDNFQKCENLLRLLHEEKDVLDQLSALNEEDPINVYDDLEQAIKRAKALGMGKRDSYRETVLTSEAHINAVADIAQCRKGLDIGAQERDSVTLRKCIGDARSILRKMKKSLPANYFDPHLARAESILPQLVKEEEKVLAVIIAALAKPGSALGESDTAIFKNFTTYEDFDNAPTTNTQDLKMDTYTIDTAALENVLSSQGYHDTSTLNSMPKLARTRLDEMSLLCSCRNLLKNEDWQGLSKVLSETTGKNPNREELGLAYREIVFIRDLSLMQTLIPELKDAMKTGRPTFSKVSSPLERSRSNSQLHSDSVSPSSPPNDKASKKDSPVSSRIKRLRRLSKRRLSPFQADSSVKAKKGPCPLVLDIDHKASLDHLTFVLNKSKSLQSEPTREIIELMRKAKTVKFLRESLQALISPIEDETRSEDNGTQLYKNPLALDLADSGTPHSDAMVDLEKQVSRALQLYPSSSEAGAAWPDILAASCELKFRKALIKLGRALQIDLTATSEMEDNAGKIRGAITGKVGALNIDHVETSNLSDALTFAKDVQVSNDHFLLPFLQVQAQALLVLRTAAKDAIDWLCDRNVLDKQNQKTDMMTSCVSALDECKKLGVHPSTWQILRDKYSIGSATTSQLKKAMHFVLKEVGLMQDEVNNRIIIQICQESVEYGGPARKVGGPLMFHRIQSQPLKETLARITNELGGCQTNLARLHRKGLHAVCQLRQALENRNERGSNILGNIEGSIKEIELADSSWHDVVVVLDSFEWSSSKTDPNIIEPYATEIISVKQEIHDQRSRAKLRMEIMTNCFDEPTGFSFQSQKMTVNTKPLEEAIIFADVGTSLGSRCITLLEVAKFQLQIRCAVNESEWNRVHRLLQSMLLQGEHVERDSQKGLAFPVESNLDGTILIDENRAEIRQLRLELNERCMKQALENALSNNSSQFLGIDRNVIMESYYKHKSKDSKTNTPWKLDITQLSSDLAGSINRVRFEELKLALDLCLIPEGHASDGSLVSCIGPPLTQEAISLFLTAQYLFAVRKHIISLDFTKLFHLLRTPKYGHHLLSQTGNIDIEDPLICKQMDVNDPFDFGESIAHFLDTFSLDYSVSTDKTLNLSTMSVTHPITLPPKSIVKELEEARNEADHVVSLCKLHEALSRGSYSCSNVGSIEQVIGAGSGNSGIFIDHLVSAMLLVDRIPSIQARSKSVTVLYCISKQILDIRRSMLELDWVALAESLQDSDGVSFPTVVPSNTAEDLSGKWKSMHDEFKGDSYIASAIADAIEEEKRARWELQDWKVRTECAKVLSAGACTGIAGSLQFSAVETRELSMLVKVADIWGVAERNPTVTGVFISVCKSILNLRAALQNNDWTRIDSGELVADVDNAAEALPSFQSFTNFAPNDSNYVWRNFPFMSFTKELNLIRGEIRSRRALMAFTKACLHGGPRGKEVGILETSKIEVAELRDALDLHTILLEEHQAQEGEDIQTISRLLSRFAMLCASLHDCRYAFMNENWAEARSIVDAFFSKDDDYDLRTISLSKDVLTEGLHIKPESGEWQAYMKALPANTQGDFFLGVSEMESYLLELQHKTMCSSMCFGLGTEQIGLRTSKSSASVSPASHAKYPETPIGISQESLSNISLSNLEASVKVCKEQGGVRSLRSRQLLATVEFIMRVRSTLRGYGLEGNPKNRWNELDAILQNEGGTLSEEGKQEIERCRRELTCHKAEIALVAACTSNSPEGSIGSFNVSSCRINELESAVKLAHSAMAKGASSLAVKRLCLYAEILMKVREEILQDQWGVLKQIMEAERFRLDIDSCESTIRTAGVKVNRYSVENFTFSRSIEEDLQATKDLSVHVLQGLKCICEELRFVQYEMENRLLLGAMSSALLEGYPRGAIGRMDTSCIELTLLQRAIHLSDPPQAKHMEEEIKGSLHSSYEPGQIQKKEMSSAYLCRSPLASNLRRLCLCILSLRAAVKLGDWNKVASLVNEYKILLPTECKNITMHQLMKSMGRIKNSEDGYNDTSPELEVVLSRSEVKFIAQEWQNQQLMLECIRALRTNCICGTVGNLSRDGVSTARTDYALAFARHIFNARDTSDKESDLSNIIVGEANPVIHTQMRPGDVPTTYTIECDRLLCSVSLVNGLRKSLLESFDEDGLDKSTESIDEIDALESTYELFLSETSQRVNKVQDVSERDRVFEATDSHLDAMIKELDPHAIEEVSLVMRHIADSRAQYKIFSALGDGGPSGSVGNFNGLVCESDGLINALAFVESLDATHVSLNTQKLAHMASHMLSVRKALKLSDWKIIATHFPAPQLFIHTQNKDQDLPEVSNSHEDSRPPEHFLNERPIPLHVVKEIEKSMASHVLEVALIEGELHHRNFIILAVRGICSNSLSGFPGKDRIDVSTVSIEGLEMAEGYYRKWRHFILNEETEDSNEMRNNLSTRLFNLVLHLKVLRAAIMRGEWHLEVMKTLLSWWFPDRRILSSSASTQNRYISNGNAALKAAIQIPLGSQEYSPVTLKEVSQSLQVADSEVDFQRDFKAFLAHESNMFLISREYEIASASHNDNDTLNGKNFHEETFLSESEVELALAEMSDRLNVDEITYAFDTGGPVRPWEVGIIRADSINTMSIYNVLQKVEARGGVKSPKMKDLMSAATHIEKLRKYASMERWDKIFEYYNTRDQTIDLDTLAQRHPENLATVVLEQNLYYAHARDDFLYKSLLESMKSGQPTGSVGSLSWPNLKNSISLLEAAIKSAEELFATSDSEMHKPSNGIVVTLSAAKQLLKLRLAICKANEMNTEKYESMHAATNRKSSVNSESSEHFIVTQDYWEIMVLPVCNSIIAGNSMQTGCHDACNHEVSICQQEAQNRASLRILWQALTSGHMEGCIGAVDISSVNVGIIERALETVKMDLGGPQSMLCESLYHIAKAILALRRSIIYGDWLDLTDNKDFSNNALSLESSKPTRAVTVASCLKKIHDSLRGISMISLKTMLDAGIPLHILDSIREAYHGDSQELSEAVRSNTFTVKMLPVDEVKFVQDEHDDRAMCRKLILALKAQKGKAHLGNIGHLEVKNISINQLEEAVLYSERLGPKSSGARNLLRSARMIISLRKALLVSPGQGKEALRKRMSRLHSVFENMSGQESIRNEAWDEIKRVRAELRDYLINRRLSSAISEGGAMDGLGNLNVNKIILHDLEVVIQEAEHEVPTTSVENNSIRSERTTSTEDFRTFDELFRQNLASAYGNLSHETISLLHSAKAIHRLRSALKSLDWDSVEDLLSGDPLLCDSSTSSLHLSAREEVKMARQQLMYRILLHDFKAAIDAAPRASQVVSEDQNVDHENASSVSSTESFQRVDYGVSECVQALSRVADFKKPHAEHGTLDDVDWIDRSDMLSQLCKTTKVVLAVRRGMISEQWEEVITNVDDFESENAGNENLFSYSDLCRELKVRVPSLSNRSELKTIGETELQWVKQYSYVKLFGSAFHRAVSSPYSIGKTDSFEKVITCELGHITMRCSDTESIESALKVAKRAGFFIAADETNRNTEGVEIISILNDSKNLSAWNLSATHHNHPFLFHNELSTLLILMKLRTAVVTGKFDALQAVMSSLQASLGASISSCVIADAYSEVALLEADVQDFAVRHALHSAMISGSVRIKSTTNQNGSEGLSKGERQRIDYASIDLRALDKALGEESFIKQFSGVTSLTKIKVSPVLKSRNSTIPSINIKNSSVTVKLFHLAKKLRKIRSRAKTGNWPPQKESHRLIFELQNTISSYQGSKDLEEAVRHADSSALNSLCGTLSVEATAMLHECNYILITEGLLESVMAGAPSLTSEKQNIETKSTSTYQDSEDPLNIALDNVEPLLDECSNIDAQYVYDACLLLKRMRLLVNEGGEDNWRRVGLIGPKILQIINKCSAALITDRLRPVQLEVMKCIRESVIWKTSINFQWALSRGAAERDARTGRLDLSTVDTAHLNAAVTTCDSWSKNKIQQNDSEGKYPGVLIEEFFDKDNRIEKLKIVASQILAMRKELLCASLDNLDGAWERALAFANHPSLHSALKGGDVVDFPFIDENHETISDDNYLSAATHVDDSFVSKLDEDRITDQMRTIGCIPSACLAEISDVIQEAKERDTCKQLKFAIATGRIAGVPGYLDFSQCNSDNLISLQQAIKDAKLLIADQQRQTTKAQNIKVHDKYIRLKELVIVAKSMEDLRMKMINCYKANHQATSENQSTKVKEDDDSKLLSFWNDSPHRDEKSNFIILEELLVRLEQNLHLVSSERLALPENQDISIVADVSELARLEFNLCRNHVREAVLQFRLLSALKNKASMVTGSVGHIDTNIASNTEILSCLDYAAKFPPESREVSKLVTTAQLVLDCRSLFLAQDWDSLLHLFAGSNQPIRKLLLKHRGLSDIHPHTKEVLNHLPSLQTDEEDVHSKILHLPSQSREELELMRSEAIYREMAITLMHACGGPSQKTGATGAAAGKVGHVNISTINFESLEFAIRILLAYGNISIDKTQHLDITNIIGDDTVEISDLSDAGERYQNLGSESIMLLYSLILLRDLRYAMKRCDWKATSKYIQKIDRFIDVRLKHVKGSIITEDGKSTLRHKFIHDNEGMLMLAAPIFIEGELLLARRECEDRKARRMLREALTSGMIGGTIDAPILSSVSTLDLSKAISSLKHGKSKNIGKRTGIHTEICRQMFETANGMLVMRRNLISNSGQGSKSQHHINNVNWKGLEKSLGKMNGLDSISHEYMKDKKIHSLSAPKKLFQGFNGRRASVDMAVSSALTLENQHSNASADSTDLTDLEALACSARERDFVSRICQNHQIKIQLTQALSRGMAQGIPGELEIVGKVSTLELERALDHVHEITGMDWDTSSNVRKESRNSSHNTKHESQQQEGQKDRRREEKIALLSVSEKHFNNPSAKSSATLSKHVAKLLTTARIILSIRRALLHTPVVLWDDIRNALAEVAALGKPRRSYISEIAFPELDLAKEILEDHDIVSQLRAALEIPEENLSFLQQKEESSSNSSLANMEALQDTIQRGKRMRRRSVQVEFLLKSAEAVVTLQTGLVKTGAAEPQSEQEVEHALEGMDMNALREAIRVTSIASMSKSSSKENLINGRYSANEMLTAGMSPTVTRLLTSAQLIHRLHSSRSMRNWEEMDAIIQDADTAFSNGRLTEKAASLANIARSELQHQNVKLELIAALKKGGVSGTIDNVVTKSIEHGELDMAIKACSILQWKEQSKIRTRDGDNTNAEVSESFAVSPELRRLLEVAKITRELRLGFALHDWASIRSATEKFSITSDAIMLEDDDMRRIQSKVGNFSQSGTKTSNLSNAVASASLVQNPEKQPVTVNTGLGMDDELLLHPRRWLQHTVKECLHEFEFATLACQHHEIMHLLTESLKGGRASGALGSINTSSVRTRDLENTIRTVNSPLCGGPQSALAIVLLNWARTVVDLRNALVEKNWDKVHSLLDECLKNNIIPDNFRRMEHRRRQLVKGSVSGTSQAILPSEFITVENSVTMQSLEMVMPIPDVVLPEITAARNELWNIRVKKSLCDACSKGGAEGEVGNLNCGSIRVSDLERAINFAEHGGQSFLTNNRDKQGGLGNIIKSLPSMSSECYELLSAARLLLRIRSSLRAGDWNEVELCVTQFHSSARHNRTGIEGNGGTSAHSITDAEIRLVQKEISDRHVIEALELFVLSNGSFSQNIGDSDRGGFALHVMHSRAGGVHEVLLSGVNSGLQDIAKNNWIPYSNQAKALYAAAKSLSNIYSAVSQRNWTEAQVLLEDVYTATGLDRWQNMLQEYTWEGISSELESLRFLVMREAATDRLRSTLIKVSGMCCRYLSAYDKSHSKKVRDAESSNFFTLSRNFVLQMEQSLEELSTELDFGMKLKTDNSRLQSKLPGALSDKLKSQMSTYSADDVHVMLILAALVVRRAARSLLNYSSSGKVSQPLGNGRRRTLTAVQGKSLLEEFRVLSNQLESVHDRSSANLLNNWELGALVQRIVDAAVGERILSQHSEEGRMLLSEIRLGLLVEQSHVTKLVSSVVDILQRKVVSSDV